MAPNLAPSTHDLIRNMINKGDASCTAADFRLPRLRRSRFDAADINWERSSLVGGGRDGYVWKVWFGEDGPYALKVFWDAESSECDSYFALQRECQNIAILQMIEMQMKRAAPILVYANPATKEDAIYNLLAFADEQLQKLPPVRDVEMTPIPAFPRIAKCYGWLPFRPPGGSKYT
ncbi:uncharacterized protein DNG_05124 [Cephalotrichum gorgonifer]|uniref:Protein kinase domain-containing protein n=1 Tax=Cephalotrichum gorgonifer TaxID=2041049 RepID=A0AAE8MX94_9PEZI|nr:uncharacterized protein DNG_05124 [Cephalotrichum gorgonifer]